MRRCCLIHLKNSSILQRDLYSCAIVSAGNSKLLVKKISLNQSSALLGIDKADATEGIGIVSGGTGSSENYRLIRRDADVGRHGVGVSAVQHNTGLGARHKESTAAMKGVQPFEVKIGTVHHIEGAGFGDDLVQQVYVMPFSLGNLNESGD